MSIEEFKSKLDRVSPTFCPIKWTHTSVNLAAGTLKTCCHNPYRKSSNSAKVFNSHFDDDLIRQKMLDGKRPKECDYCFKMEDLGHFSDRIYWSQKPWMRGAIEEILHHNKATVLAPKWLEINLGPICNLKCSYCGPEVSSSWNRELIEHGPYPTDPPHNDIKWLKSEGRYPYGSNINEFQNRFWDWLNECLPSVRLLSLTGGEPLLHDGFFTILERIQKNPMPQMEIAINSNLSVPKKIWARFVSIAEDLTKNHKVKSLFLHPSLDSWGKKAEYIRYGLDFNLFLENLDSFLDQTISLVVINCTINNLSLSEMPVYWQYIIDLKKKYPDRYISSTLEPVIYPDWQRISLLPKSFISPLEQSLSLLLKEKSQRTSPIYEQETKRIERAIELIRQGEKEPYLSTQKANFYRFFSEHDRRRGTDFESTFPEMLPFWRECEALAKG